MTKSWKVEIKEQLTVVSPMPSDYVLPVYKIFLDSLLSFTVRVYLWALPDNHGLIQPYGVSFNNVKALIIEASHLLRTLSSISVETFHDFAIVFCQHFNRLAEGFQRLDVVFNHYFSNSLKSQT